MKNHLSLLATIIVLSGCYHSGSHQQDGWDIEVDIGEPEPDPEPDVDPDLTPDPVCGNGILEDGEECDTAENRECTTSCGSNGVQACLSCAWDPYCSPPEEMCNGVDDDCDGEVDEVCDCAAAWVQAVPVGDALDAVWVAPGGAVYGAGYGGTIVRTDGSTTVRMESGTTADVHSIWGASEDDIYAVTFVLSTLDGGDLLHYDGAQWSTLLVDESLLAVWGRSESDVFAVGDGVILHFDGSEWTREIREGERFSHVWGTPDGDVLAVTGLSVLRFNGVGWEEISSIPETLAFGVLGAWGSSARDIFLAVRGDFYGHLFHYDGTGFEEISPGVEGCFAGVWGSSADDVHVVGSYGLSLHYDGTAWTSMDSGTDETLRAVGGNAAGDVYAVGGNKGISSIVQRYDGHAWSPAAALAPPVTFHDVYGFPDGVVATYPIRYCYFPFLANPCVLCCYGDYYEEPANSSLHLNVRTWRGVSWMDHSVTAVWGEAGDALMGVGFFRHPRGGFGSSSVQFDGRRWRQSEDDFPLECEIHFESSDIWGASPTDVFAVGPGICHYDGETWQPMPSPAAVDRIWGSSGRDVYAVGGNTVLHYDGESWSVAASLGPDVQLAGVWAVSHDDVFVVGDNGNDDAPAGLIFHYDGVAWSRMDIDFAGSLRDVSGAPEGKVLAIGTGGGMLRYDGVTWEPIESGTSEDLNAVWARSDSDVYVVGDNGTILHRCGTGW